MARNLVTLEPSPELYKKLKTLSKRTGLPMAQVVRLGVTQGLPQIEKQLLALTSTQKESDPAKEV